MVPLPVVLTVARLSLPLSLHLLVQGAGHRPPGQCPTATDSAPPRAPRRAQDRLQPPVMPVLWSNDYGGITVGVRARPACRDDAERGLFVASTATSSTATSSVSLYARWNNPLSGLWPRVATSVAAWSIEGRTSDAGGGLGRACSAARSSVRRDPCGSCGFPSPGPTRTRRSRTRSSTAVARYWCGRDSTISHPEGPTCGGFATTSAGAGRSA